MHRELAVLLALLTGCSTYQVPQKELARLETLAQEDYQKKINPAQVFPENHPFPEYQDHFFYFLYHLEKQPGNYYIDGGDLEDFFDRSGLESLIPLDKIKLITKENKILSFYNEEFEEVIPGTLGQVSLKASKNIEFRVQNSETGLELFLRRGSLRTDTTPLARQLADFCDFNVRYISATPSNLFFGCWSGTILTGKQSYFFFRGVEYDLPENKAQKSSRSSIILSEAQVEK